MALNYYRFKGEGEGN